MIIFDSYSGGCAQMRCLSRKSQERVKFPDIWSVYRSFQKQTLNIILQIILYSFFMLKPRDPSLSFAPVRIKTIPFSNPVSVNRQLQDPSAPTLTNKQSVYGLFLDELLQYYKLMPFELDFSFIKSMRKIHTKGNEYVTEDQLQKAAQILIEAKNKQIKQQIDQYDLQCQAYLRKCPKALSTAIKLQAANKYDQPLKPRKIATRHTYKKVIPQQKFFDKVKSEGNQQNYNSASVDKRSSFLLHPKSIHFQSSNQIIKRVQKLKQGEQICRLPKIAQSNRIFQDKIRFSVQKNKHVRVFFSPINRSQNANSERAILLRNILFSSKHSDTASIQKEQTTLMRQKKQLNEINFQFNLPKPECPKKNRKLMLQLLRQKNKQTYLKD